MVLTKHSCVTFSQLEGSKRSISYLMFLQWQPCKYY